MNPEELPSSEVRRLSSSSVVPVCVIVTPGVLVSGVGDGDGEGAKASLAAFEYLLSHEVADTEATSEKTSEKETEAA